LQADEGDGQQKQEMVGTQQRVTNATEQSLQGGEGSAVAHAKGVVGERRTGQEKNRQKRRAGDLQRPAQGQWQRIQKSILVGLIWRAF
jgi:RNase P/RNase MRP subunit p29